MSLADNALTNVNDFKDYIKLSETTHDEVIEELISAATKWIENYCGRSFYYDNSSYGVYSSSTTPDDSIYDGLGCKDLFVRQFPIISITQILTVDSYSSGVASTTTMDVDTYVVNKRLGIISRLGGRTWGEGTQNIYVDYKAGYATIPSDLKQACNEIVKSYYQDRAKNTNVKREEMGEYEIEMHIRPRMPFWAQEILNSYKVVNI